MSNEIQKGVTLYLAIIVTLLILGIGLGIGSLLTTQIRTTRSIEESLQALYAADAGIERLRMIDKCMSFTGSRSQRVRRDCLIVVLEVRVHGDLPNECKGGGDGGLLSADKQICRQKSFANVIEAAPSNTVGGGEYSLCKNAGVPNNCNIDDPDKEGCTGATYCVKSTGTFKQTTRAIEVVK